MLNVKAKAMMVEKVREEREKSELKDLTQQIELLTSDYEECDNRDSKGKR